MTMQRQTCPHPLGGVPVNGTHSPPFAAGQVCEGLHFAEAGAFAAEGVTISIVSLADPRKIIFIDIDNVILLQGMLIPARQSH